MTQIGTMPGQLIGLSRITPGAGLVPQVKSPIAPATDTVDLSDTARNIIAAGNGSTPVSQGPISDFPIVLYADGFFAPPAKQPPAPNKPIVKGPNSDFPIVTYADGYFPPKVAQAPVKDESISRAPKSDFPIVTYAGGYFPPKLSPIIEESTPVAVNVPKKKLPAPIVSNNPQPVTIDYVYTLNSKFSRKTPPVVQAPAPETSGAAKLSSLSGRFIAPYNTALFLKLFGA